MIPEVAVAQLYIIGGRTIMDRISESLLNEFSAVHGITLLPEEKRFEHFASYVTVKRHHSETFDTEDLVMGAGGDTGIDGIAIIVNGSLITDVESFEQLAEKAGNLDVLFVFVQAERSASFEAAKIGTFGFGVIDFFKESGHSMIRSERISASAEIMTAIYKRSSKFNRSNPACWLNYVTTGKWVGDTVLEARRSAVVSDLKGTGLFSKVEFVPVDAEELQRLYRQTKNAVSREFLFTNRTVVPEVPGVSEAYLGFLPVSEFIKLLQDDNGEIIGGLFYDNVRDWQDYNQVNSEIKATLESEASDRFVLMNNGVTIIANKVQPTGNKFYIEDYQIVNGCQTSHVLFNNRDKLNDRVMVPVRLIGTQDEGITNAIIRATNRQTEVKEEQFFALQEFPKELELYFQSFPDSHKLYYERRSRQYDRLSIEKTRIVVPSNLVKAVAAMFLGEPHRTTRNYGAISSKVSKDIFVKGHKMEPYYTAALCLYKLEYVFRNRRLEPKYKPARFHILLAARMLVNSDPLPQWNSREMERYCNPIMEILWDGVKADELMTRAAAIIDEVAADNFHRDNIRTEPFTRKVVERCTDANKVVRSGGQ
ncbi:AIPR family protein [Gloeobacter violaceus]|uniref:AIPR family protein n=1 Tax=Gloeobacter violaceus TaxID=33072 RepID=UPI0013E8C329|nr:AIPR family protein [Gloeobacter violaceus]